MIREVIINEDEVAKYIEACHSRAEKHFRNSINARKWHRLLEFTGSFVAAAMSLTLPLLAVTNSDAITVAIVGNSYVFAGVVLTALQKTYGFNTLEIIHNHLSSEFSDLESEFRNLQRRHSVTNDLEHGRDDEIEKLIVKYQGICSKSNIQGIKDCHWCCCYN